METIRWKNWVKRYLVRVQDLQHMSFPEVRLYAPWFLGATLAALASGLVGTAAAWVLLPGKISLQIPQPPSHLRMPPPPTGTDFPSVLGRNLFNADGKVPEDSDRTENTTCSPEPVASTLPWKFSGLLFGGKPEWSIVALESTQGKEPLTLTLGSAIDGSETRLVDITPEQILISHSGCLEFLKFDRPDIPRRSRVAGQARSHNDGAAVDMSMGTYSEPGLSRVGNRTSTTEAYFHNAITSDLVQHLHDAKANQFLVNGEVKGFTLDNIRPGSIYEKVGIQSGDMVDSVNGIELRDAIRAINTLQTLQNEKDITIRVIRGGKPVDLQIQVK